jgi:hypothetical protein
MVFLYIDAQVLLGGAGDPPVPNGNTEKGAEFGQSDVLFVGNKLNPSFIGER